MSAPATEHVSELGYTREDDGVWITCSCRWEHNLGYSPTVEEAAGAWAAHLAAQKPTDDERTSFPIQAGGPWE